MPQMMPLNWIYMFIQLTTITSMVMVLVYFTSSPSSPGQNSNLTPPQASWKW